MARGVWGVASDAGGLTAAQIAGLMGCSERTAKRYLYQYCKKVRAGVRKDMSLDDVGTLIEQYRYVLARKKIWDRARQPISVPRPTMRELGYDVE